MKSKLAIGFFVAGMTGAGLALAAPDTRDMVKSIQTQGWFKTCPGIMASLSAMPEPSDHASDTWRDFVLLRAGCLTEEHREVEAIAFVKSRMAATGRRDANLLNFLGISQLRAGKDQEAIASFEEALQYGVHDLTKKAIYSKMAGAYTKIASQTGSRDPELMAKAEQYGQLAVDHNTGRGDPSISAQLATIKALREDYAGAIRLFDDALARNTAYPHWKSENMRKVMQAEFTMGKGQALYNQGAKTQGAALMAQAVEIAPTDNLKTVMSALREVTLNPVPAGQLPEILLVPSVPLDEDV